MNNRSFDPKTYTRRNSNRLPAYNYRSSGAYFITICTEKRQRVLEIPIIHAALLEKWQRDYYEHVIRNEEDLKLTREYIVNNPLKALLLQEERYEEMKRSRTRKHPNP